MFDEIKKKITLILSGKDEGATDALGKVDRRVSSLEAKLKTLGKISGIGAFRGLSDLAEGADSALGPVGKLGITLAAIEGSGRAMKAIGESLSMAAEGADGLAGALDKAAMKIPVLGTMKDGFETLTEGIGKATAATLGFNVARSGRIGKGVGRAITGVGILNAIDAVDNYGGVSAAQEKSNALDDRTKTIRSMIDANNRDRAESERIQRERLTETQKIEADRDAALEKIMDRRREWAARNAGLSKEAEERFAADEQAIKTEASEKIQKIEKDRNESVQKILEERLKQDKEYQKARAEERQAIARQQAIDASKIEDTIERNDRIQRAMQSDIFNSQLAAQEERRQREEAGRATALGTQQGARTSTLDGRGITGYLTQSRQVDQFAKSTADNTKSTVDELKRLPAAIAQNVFGALGGIASF